MWGMKILATAEALPEWVVPTAEVAGLCGIDPVAAERATGVRERRWVRPDEDPVDLGAAALTSALARAGVAVDDLDVLIHASGSFPQPLPDGSAFFARRIGFSGRPSFSVHATCVSTLVALHQAALLIDAGVARTVAIVTCEVASRGLDFTDPESSLLFGDGAAAIVVGRAERDGQGVVAYRSEIHPEALTNTQIPGGGYLMPGRDDARTPADFTFHMSGLALLRLARRLMPPFLEALHPGLGSGMADVDRVIPHQTSAAGMAMAARFGWPSDRVESTLAELGNMIAASLPVTLHRALAAGRLGDGDRVLLVGTGAGLNLTGMVLQL